MDNKSNESTAKRAVEAAEELMLGLLEDGVPGPDISFALVFAATHFGLQMAPSSAQAIAVLTDAIRQAATNFAFADSNTESSNDANTSGGELININPEVFGRTVH